MTHSFNEPRRDSDASELARLCRGIALRCAMINRCSLCNCEDFSQQFAVAVLTSANVVMLLDLPLESRCALLTRMARLDCIDFVRSLRRQQVTESVELQRIDACGEPWDLELADAGADPSARQVWASLRAALDAAVESLQPSARAVVKCRYLEGSSVAQIAAQTGRSEVAVRQCLCAARRTLRSRLTALGWTEADARAAAQPPAAPCLVDRNCSDGD